MQKSSKVHNHIMNLILFMTIAINGEKCVFIPALLLRPVPALFNPE
uniref:Uncharacterized protein n=1 Tax=uncultured Desulfobacterium sp. TaxID=201089 RepID=E1YEU0_9BACT|nr:unknown protein [uncultured Desulfobacterium sp.]